MYTIPVYDALRKILIFHTTFLGRCQLLFPFFPNGTELFGYYFALYAHCGHIGTGSPPGEPTKGEKIRMEYREFGPERLPRVLEIYESAGWTAYLGDGEALAEVFRNSLYTLGAFDGGRLAGFVRCVGDGVHIVYVQDLIVDLPYKRQGIGRALLRAAMERYAHVRMFALATDASDPDSSAFYTAMGMGRWEDGGCVGYLRLERRGHPGKDLQ